MPKENLKKATVNVARKKEQTSNPLFVKKVKNYGIGQDILPKRDLTRYVKWPNYIQLQRKKAILMQRLKVPPSINQFSKALDKHTAFQLLQFASMYKPETRQQKKERLLKAAEDKNNNIPEKPIKKPFVIKKGVNHITALIEQKKAKLVIIAHDVDPIEIVVWLPALCHKLGVPYCIIKGKSRLGSLVHYKKAAVLAFVDIRDEDKGSFNKLLEAINANFLEKWSEHRKLWGGDIMSKKSRDAAEKLKLAKEQEINSRIL